MIHSLACFSGLLLTEGSAEWVIVVIRETRKNALWVASRVHFCGDTCTVVPNAVMDLDSLEALSMVMERIEN